MGEVKYEMTTKETGSQSMPIIIDFPCDESFEITNSFCLARDGNTIPMEVSAEEYEQLKFLPEKAHEDSDFFRMAMPELWNRIFEVIQKRIILDACREIALDNGERPPRSYKGCLKYFHRIDPLNLKYSYEMSGVYAPWI